MLEGRELPAPADTDAFLTATYGPSWRVPDPAYKFETPVSTHRRLNGWFRGTRVRREAWDRTYSRLPSEPPPIEPSPFTGWVRRHEQGIPGRIVDIGCGRGVDDLWFARRGASVLGLDYAPRGWRAVEQLAGDEDVDLEFRRMNLVELRSVLAESARVARTPGRTVVTAQHVADTTDKVGRRYLWRACEMMTRGPERGRLYLQVLTGRGEEDAVAREEHLRPLRMVTARRGHREQRRHRGLAATVEAAPPGHRGRTQDRTIGGRMASLRDLRSRVRASSKRAARNLGRFRAGVQAEGVEALRERVSVLEDEVQECRQLNLRLAELTDVVQELLLPVAQRDEKAISAALEKYSEGL